MAGQEITLDLRLNNIKVSKSMLWKKTRRIHLSSRFKRFCCILLYTFTNKIYV